MTSHRTISRFFWRGSLTQDLPHDPVSLVRQLLLAEQLGLALQPAGSLLPGRLCRVGVVRRYVGCPVHLLCSKGGVKALFVLHFDIQWILRLQVKLNLIQASCLGWLQALVATSARYVWSYGTLVSCWWEKVRKAQPGLLRDPTNDYGSTSRVILCKVLFLRMCMCHFSALPLGADDW